jgi:hypothetical protein
LFIRVIYFSIIGARQARTPIPQRIKNGNQEIPVPACIEIRTDAVAENTGAPQAHIKGKVYTFGGLT